MGFYVIDTAGSLSLLIHTKTLPQIGKKIIGFNWSASGAALLEGILLTLASGVVYLADHDKFSPELMGAGAGLGRTVGYFISRSAGRRIIIGKRKYRLEYVRMTGN